MIKALGSGQEFRFRPQVPLANHVRSVILFLKLLGDRDLIRMQSQKPVGTSLWVDPHVEPAALWIRAGQKRSPRR